MQLPFFNVPLYLGYISVLFMQIVLPKGSITSIMFDFLTTNLDVHVGGLGRRARGKGREENICVLLKFQKARTSLSAENYTQIFH